ncbi:TonB family protein [Sandaracinus amylolyticus]|nr:TonB family protein [Sandaracinus amylolyticus]
MTRSARAMSYGAAVSLLAHLAIAWLLPTLSATRTDAADAPAELAIDVRFSDEAGDGTAVRVPGAATPLEPGGADPEHNVDARDRGQGGDRTGAQRVIRLLPRADQVTLSDAPMNALGVGQTQRIETARDRATREDRRATPHPADDPFLASGDGEHPERRPVARVDAAPGARVAPEAGTRGAPIAGSERVVTADSGSTRGGTNEGALTTEPSGAASDSPGRGIVRGRGARATESARVALGRPTVDEAAAATPSESRDARVRDDTDAELLAARMMQSVVESTQRRGEEDGEGRGGARGLGAPGTGGGRREGGRARALGPGDGAYDALDTSDGRYRRWFVETRRRIENAMVFPRERAMRMDQGTSVVELVVRRDGTLARAPRVVRSSGFDDFDGAAIAAIRSTIPFSPLPDDLVPGRESLRIRMPLEFSNPMVR